jgi:hypothetical protein
LIFLHVYGRFLSIRIVAIAIAINQSAATTTVSFTVTGESGTTGFSNITIPKSTIQSGISPVILVDGQQATNQGYTQDADNFYIWYTTQFSTHNVIIQFVVPSTAMAYSFGSVLAIGITVPEIILIYTVIAVRRLRRKPDNA